MINGVDMSSTDNKILKLTVREFFSVNHYLAYRGIYSGGRCMAVCYKTTSAKTFQKEFAEYVKNEVEKQGWIKPDDRYRQIILDATYYFPKTNMDSNNHWKVTLDAITDSGVVWIDDKIVCERCKRIYYDSEDPRIEYEVRVAEHIGIFDNEEQLRSFEEHCRSCSRYRDGVCSIFKKASEGRIQDCIVDLECQKYKARKK